MNHSEPLQIATPFASLIQLVEVHQLASGGTGSGPPSSASLCQVKSAEECIKTQLGRDGRWQV